MGKREDPFKLIRDILGGRVITVSDWYTGKILWEELGSTRCASLPEGVGYDYNKEGTSLQEDQGDQQ